MKCTDQLEPFKSRTMLKCSIFQIELVSFFLFLQTSNADFWILTVFMFSNLVCIKCSQPLLVYFSVVQIITKKWWEARQPFRVIDKPLRLLLKPWCQTPYPFHSPKNQVSFILLKISSMFTFSALGGSYCEVWISSLKCDYCD